MRVLPNRRAVIEWAGGHHAYPLQKVNDPSEVRLAQAGDDESGYRRVGWEHFFGPLERHHRVVAVADDGSFSYHVLPREEARRALPPEAFGEPWWRHLLHEVWLTRKAA
ncbi:MAG TPA: hypothetical protein VMB50_08185 [Myxococcales bacterium]|nr:hypothetical protein [Myxococcales bacterium]